MSARPTEPQTRDRPQRGFATPADPAQPAGSPDADRMAVSGTQVAASVLASVSAAVVASFFGVAGTVAGAAVVSVVATVGSAAYGRGLRRTQQRLQQVQGLRITRPLSPVPRDGGTARREVVESDVLSAGAPSPDGWRGWLAQRRWGVAAGVAIVFVISLATVTLIEVVGDRPLSGEAADHTSIGVPLPGGGNEDGRPDAPATTVPSAGSPSVSALDDGGEDGNEDGGGSPVTAPSPGDATTSTSPATSTTMAPTSTAPDEVPTTTAPSIPAPPPVESDPSPG
jgi:hypothetical protein